MLTKFRIEVREASPEECVRALWLYEHVLQQAECARYRMLYADTGTAPPGEPESEAGRDGPRDYYNGQLDRDLHEEVIELIADETTSESGAGWYRGRRVVSFAPHGNRIIPVSEQRDALVVEPA